jgi:hypothetical protein
LYLATLAAESQMLRPKLSQNHTLIHTKSETAVCYINSADIFNVGLKLLYSSRNSGPAVLALAFILLLVVLASPRGLLPHMGLTILFLSFENPWKSIVLKTT